jgi:hypothetical protein
LKKMLAFRKTIVEDTYFRCPFLVLIPNLKAKAVVYCSISEFIWSISEFSNLISEFVSSISEFCQSISEFIICTDFILIINTRESSLESKNGICYSRKIEGYRIGVFFLPCRVTLSEQIPETAYLLLSDQSAENNPSVH